MCSDGSFCPRNTDDLNMTCCDNTEGQLALNSGAPLSAYLRTSSEAAKSTSKLESALLSSSISSGPSTLTPSTISTSVSFSSSTSTPNLSQTHITTNPSPTPGSSPDGGIGLSRAAEIATIVGSVLGAIALVLTLVFGINGWRKRRFRRL